MMSQPAVHPYCSYPAAPAESQYCCPGVPTQTYFGQQSTSAELMPSSAAIQAYNSAIAELPNGYDAFRNTGFDAFASYQMPQQPVADGSNLGVFPSQTLMISQPSASARTSPSITSPTILQCHRCACYASNLWDGFCAKCATGVMAQYGSSNIIGTTSSITNRPELMHVIYFFETARPHNDFF
ncbi:unnamed protein product [Gongylonema pulchrum]|uniref:Uncharacterized protein n=1 Tax=Gongylonema pulchrum TaxID=637853 RepID=A0A3P6PQY4_9BILA|nr:unnamed protein product [Gongylonema pulchrum]